MATSAADPQRTSCESDVSCLDRRPVKYLWANSQAPTDNVASSFVVCSPMAESVSPLPEYTMGQEIGPSSPGTERAPVLLSPPPGYISQHPSSITSPSISIGNNNHSRYFSSASEPISPLGTLRSKRSTVAPRPVSQAMPSNYVKISRKGSAKEPSPYKGTFTINPTLNIPADILAAISNGRRASRKNLELNVEEGSIDVDVLLTTDDNGDPSLLYPTITNGTPVTIELGLVTSPTAERDNIYPVLARIVSYLLREFGTT